MVKRGRGRRRVPSSLRLSIETAGFPGSGLAGGRTGPGPRHGLPQLANELFHLVATVEVCRIGGFMAIDDRHQRCVGIQLLRPLHAVGDLDVVRGTSLEAPLDLTLHRIGGMVSLHCEPPILGINKDMSGVWLNGPVWSVA